MHVAPDTSTVLHYIIMLIYFICYVYTIRYIILCYNIIMLGHTIIIALCCVTLHSFVLYTVKLCCVYCIASHRIYRILITLYRFVYYCRACNQVHTETADDRTTGEAAYRLSS